MSNQDLGFLFSKVGDISKATHKKAMEIVKAAQAEGHAIRFVWGYRDDHAEHGTHRCVDIMVFNEAAGDFVRNYTWANRRRFGLRHVIWEQHITSTVTQPGVRRQMADRGNPTANHMDHCHILFLDGYEYEPPKSKPQVPARPKPQGKPTVKVRVLREGMHGSDVEALQRGINRVFHRGLKVDGQFGPNTEAAVQAAQNRCGIKPDGIVGPITRKAFKKRGMRL